MIVVYGYENGEFVVINIVGLVIYFNFVIYMNWYFFICFLMLVGSLGIIIFLRINYVWRLIYLLKFDRVGLIVYYNLIFLVFESNFIKYYMSIYIIYVWYL